jgi:hypothetical protein
VSGLPEPPSPAQLSWRLETLAAGTRLVRVHASDYGEIEFNPSVRPSARFRPIGEPVVPTLYAGVDEDVAIAEGLFHDVPIRPDALRHYYLAGLNGRVISELAPTRELALIELHGYGLQQLGVTHAELIETPAAGYEWTARWARALHAADPLADGMVWMSRRFTGRRAMILWEEPKRIEAGDLAITVEARPLWRDAGRKLVLQVAQQAGIRLLA